MADESVQGENSEVDEETSDLNPEEDSKKDVGRDILDVLEAKFPGSTFDAEAFSNFEDELSITLIFGLALIGWNAKFLIFLVLIFLDILI